MTYRLHQFRSEWLRKLFRIAMDVQRICNTIIQEQEYAYYQVFLRMNCQEISLMILVFQQWQYHSVINNPQIKEQVRTEIEQLNYYWAPIRRRMINEAPFHDERSYQQHFDEFVQPLQDNLGQLITYIRSGTLRLEPTFPGN
jgi:hypothetical protein